MSGGLELVPRDVTFGHTDLRRAHWSPVTSRRRTIEVAGRKDVIAVKAIYGRYRRTLGWISRGKPVVYFRRRLPTFAFLFV